MVLERVLPEYLLKCFSLKTFVHLKGPVAVDLKNNY